MATAMPDLPPRHLSLDVLRGVAVMGIVLANLPGFALPAAAYFSPRAWGGSDPADLTVWFANFVLVEGKFRGLFSFLFGASTLLIMERAAAAGENEVAVQLRRLAVLFVFGCAHRYLLWWGDILAHYALVGTIALLFAGASARVLCAVAAGLTIAYMAEGLSVSALLFAHTSIGAAYRAANEAVFGIPDPASLSHEIAAMRGTWWQGVAWRWTEGGSPFDGLTTTGIETLSAMLLGMAAYRSGFATGNWSRRAYRRIAKGGLAFCWIGYAILGWNTLRSGFAVADVQFASIAASAPFRLAGVVGYAALVILLLRNGGALTRRIAAVGRTAFTNYIGTSAIMLLIFTAFGLFARIGRAELYLLAPLLWATMLSWSPAWLRHFRQGPLEGIWRRLARP